MNVQQLGNTPHINDLIQQACNWNAARYEQVYDHYLTISLLTEEFNEAANAWQHNDKLEVVDGLADVFFVAIGAMWKLGMPIIEIPKALQHTQATVEFLPPIGIGINWYDVVQHPAILSMVALAAVNELSNTLGSPALALWAIKAVCDSNDTKEVKKTASDIKANATKGADYVSPKARIKELLNA